MYLLAFKWIHRARSGTLHTKTINYITVLDATHLHTVKLNLEITRNCHFSNAMPPNYQTPVNPFNHAIDTQFIRQLVWGQAAWLLAGHSTEANLIERVWPSHQDHRVNWQTAAAATNGWLSAQVSRAHAQPRPTERNCVRAKLERPHRPLNRNERKSLNRINICQLASLDYYYFSVGDGGGDVGAAVLLPVAIHLRCTTYSGVVHRTQKYIRGMREGGGGSGGGGSDRASIVVHFGYICIEIMKVSWFVYNELPNKLSKCQWSLIRQQKNRPISAEFGLWMWNALLCIRNGASGAMGQFYRNHGSVSP